MYAIVESSVTNIEVLNKKPLSQKLNYAVGSGMSGSTPYLVFDTLYLLGEGEEKVTGVLKGLSAETDQSLKLCIHNEVGYRKTFLKVFESFLSAFTDNTEELGFYDAVYQVTFNDYPVGYAYEKYSVDADGDILAKSGAALLVPVDASSISRSDEKITSWSRPDGSLINKTIHSITNSKLESSFALEPKDDKWFVKGELQGKEVNEELNYKDWLLSEYGMNLSVLNLKKSDEQSAEYYIWEPEVDPVNATKLVISKIEGELDANIKINNGPMLFESLIDENGIFRSGSMELGPVKMQLESVYSRGKPVLK